MVIINNNDLFTSNVWVCSYGYGYLAQPIATIYNAVSHHVAKPRRRNMYIHSNLLSLSRLQTTGLEISRSLVPYHPPVNNILHRVSTTENNVARNVRFPCVCACAPWTASTIECRVVCASAQRSHRPRIQSRPKNRQSHLHDELPGFSAIERSRVVGKPSLAV